MAKEMKSALRLLKDINVTTKQQGQKIIIETNIENKSDITSCSPVE